MSLNQSLISDFSLSSLTEHLHRNPCSMVFGFMICPFHLSLIPTCADALVKFVFLTLLKLVTCYLLLVYWLLIHLLVTDSVYCYWFIYWLLIHLLVTDSFTGYWFMYWLLIHLLVTDSFTGYWFIYWLLIRYTGYWFGLMVTGYWFVYWLLIRFTGYWFVYWLLIRFTGYWFVYWLLNQ